MINEKKKIKVRPLVLLLCFIVVIFSVIIFVVFYNEVNHKESGESIVCPIGKPQQVENGYICIKDDYYSEFLINAYNELDLSEEKFSTFTLFRTIPVESDIFEELFNNVNISGVKMIAPSGQQLYIQINLEDKALKEALNQSLEAMILDEDHPVILKIHEFFQESLANDELMIIGGVVEGSGVECQKWWKKYSQEIRFIVPSVLGPENDGYIPLPDEPVSHWRKSSDEEDL